MRSDIHVIDNVLSNFERIKLLWFLFLQKRTMESMEPDFDSKRWGRHNPPWLKRMHIALTPLAERLSNKKLKPSYVYYSAYTRESYLPLHIDRVQCDVTLDYCILQPIDWPLYVADREISSAISERIRHAANKQVELDLAKNEASNRFTQIDLRPNQLVMFEGTQCWHYRDPIPTGAFADLAFFHYVPVEFAESLD